MTQSALGIIDKMRIEVFDKSGSSTPKKTIFVQLNPEKYSMKQNVVFVRDNLSAHLQMI